jgi:predicted alpha-1,6-mannanase (GH76 family)
MKRIQVFVVACLGVLFLQATVSAQTAAEYHNRADSALQSFLVKFFNGGQQYLRHNFPDTGQLTGYWTYANGWDAMLDGVERTGGQQYSGLIETLWLGQEERGWLVQHYDDEAWMAMALIRAYDLTGDSKYLSKAQDLFADIQLGWDTTCCGGTPGGIWWDKAHTQKATASNAGPVIAGVRLYGRTGNAAYLAFAQNVYSYWWANMVNFSTYQIADHIEPNGNKIWWKFTYNEGLMIGASVELYEATGTPSYLSNAHNIANFMISNEVVSTSYGNVLFDGTNSGCGGDCHEFKGPGFRYLHRLYQKDTSKTQYFIVLKASALIFSLSTGRVLP